MIGLRGDGKPGGSIAVPGSGRRRRSIVSTHRVRLDPHPSADDDNSTVVGTTNPARRPRRCGRGSLPTPPG
jgi:hypothetical protein